ELLLTFCMRLLSILVLGFFLSSCDQHHDPPNILMIVVDDLGYSDLHCYGNDLVETPNIDRLASEGIRFTQAYASCTVCSPTRASLMTGKNPVVVNITDWIPGNQAYRSDQKPQEKYLVPLFNQQLPLGEITIAEKLSEAGYVCGSIGKWHLGGEGFLPTDQGFDLNVGGYSKGSPPSYYYPYTRKGRSDVITPLELTGDSLYLTDRLTNEAIRFMNEEREEPFFLYLPFYNVHTPLEGRADLLEKYEAKLTGHQNDTILRNPHFLAMTEAVDENVGRLMQFLEGNGLSENTLVVFTSDNGGLLLRGRQDSRFIRASWNHPLREGKGTLYEGGLRIPAIVRWAGHIEAGESQEIIISTDLYPTLAEVAGASIDHSIEGTSLLPHLLSGNQLDREILHWHYPHYHLGMPGGVIRDGDFKLIEYYESGELELYNLAEDSSETTNLVAELPEKAISMQQKLHNWRTSNHAKMPTPNPAYKPDLNR
ncbi:MAG: sulfatase, partial [Bacteroidales bacterium]|nr:sulfatase [Bacteroidales bacterium]